NRYDPPGKQDRPAGDPRHLSGDELASDNDTESDHRTLCPATPPDPARWTMNAWLAKLLPAALLLALAAAPSPAAPTVKDDGNLFSEQTEKEANAIIADIQRRFNKEVHVETYNKPP